MSSFRMAYCTRCRQEHGFGFDEVGAPVELSTWCRPGEPPGVSPGSITDQEQLSAEEAAQIRQVVSLLSEGEDGKFDPVRWVENVHIPALKINGPPHAARIVGEAIRRLKTTLDAAEKRAESLEVAVRTHVENPCGCNECTRKLEIALAASEGEVGRAQP